MLPLKVRSDYGAKFDKSYCFIGALSSDRIKAILEAPDSGSDLDVSDSGDEYIPAVVPAPGSDSESDLELGDQDVIPPAPESLDDPGDVAGPSKATSGCSGTPERRLFFRINNGFGNGDGDTASAHTSRPEGHGASTLSPNAYFKEFIPDTMIRLIADMSNRHQVAQTGRSLLLKPDECRRFFGVNMLMSVLRFPWMRMYWAGRTRLPVISDAISRDRFFKIRSCLKIVSDADVPDEVKSEDRLWKVRPLLKCIREGCLRLPRPKEVSIDEQMVPFSGKTSLKQYMPGKPNPEGLKNFVVAATDGLILDFEVYQGKRLCARDGLDGKEWFLGESVVMRLIETLDPGTCVYFDRYFTTPRLLETLKDQGMDGTGTVKKNMLPKKANLPPESGVKRWERGTSETHMRSDGKLGITVWKDNKPLYMASTTSGKEPVDTVRRYKKKERAYIEVERPNVVAKYNRCMGGVDLHNRMLAHYRSGSKTKKWTIRTILHFFDLAAVQAWLLYKRDYEAQHLGSAKTKFLEFKYDLAMSLICQEDTSEGSSSANEEGSSEEEDAEKDLRPLARGFRAMPHADIVSSGQHLPKTHVRANWKRCRMNGCRKLTGTECRRCRIFLCCVSDRDCFYSFHTKKR